MRTSFGSDRYQASESDALCSVAIAGSASGCLYFPGVTGTAAGMLALPEDMLIAQALAVRGLRVMIADWGGSTAFGNDTAVTRAETGRVYQVGAQGTVGTKVVLFGASMGSILALRYAMAFPSRVAAIALALPIPDVQGMYDGNVGGFQALIGAAYGARPSNAQNPASNPSAFAGIPMRLWYSTDDATSLPVPALAFAAAAGAAVTSMGAVGHVLPGSIGPDVASFLGAYA